MRIPPLPLRVIPLPDGFGLQDAEGVVFWASADRAAAEEACARFTEQAELCPQLPGRCQGFVEPDLVHTHTTDHRDHLAWEVNTERRS